MTTAPFRFGIVSGADSALGWARLVRRAEELGYSAVYLSDHLDVSGAHVSTMSPLIALANAAALSTDLRLGTSVLNQDLRHPAVLAREAASLQLLSDGRLELGIGAGWAEAEYNWAGISFDDAATRLARLDEYLHVVKALLHPGVVDFSGRFFTISQMPSMTTVGLPAPRIMVGGARNAMLRLAARHADIVNIGMVNRPWAGWASMDEKVRMIRAAAPDPDRLQLSTMVVLANVSSSDRSTAFQERLQEQADGGHPVPTGGLPLDALVDSPAILTGSVEQLVDELVERRRRWGLAYHLISYPDMEAFAPVVAALAGR